MSTDFSIKSVGAPVATPVVQPVSEATAQAVATELPPSQTVTAADPAPAIRNDSNLVPRSLTNQVVIDREAASLVYQVVDNRTSQVVRQFPEEAVLRRRAYFNTLDLTKPGPHRMRATDRSA
jgi:hypothetical protein